MRGIVLSIMLALAACQGTPRPPAAGAAPAMRGWELASGKAPTGVEFAALLAACEDRANSAAAQPGAAGLYSCLADLGLKRAAP